MGRTADAKNRTNNRTKNYTFPELCEALEKHGTSITELSKQMDVNTKDITSLKKTQDTQGKDIESLKKENESLKKEIETLKTGAKTASSASTEAKATTETAAASTGAKATGSRTLPDDERFAQRYYANGFISESEGSFAKVNGFTEKPELAWVEFNARGDVRTMTEEDMEFQGIITRVTPRK